VARSLRFYRKGRVMASVTPLVLTEHLHRVSVIHQNSPHLLKPYWKRNILHRSLK
jgi:hypothetical protein